MAKLQIEGVVNTRAQVESELAQVQRALAVEENARLICGVRAWSCLGGVGCSRGSL